MKQISIFILSIMLFTSCSNKTAVDTKAEAEKLMQTSRDWSKFALDRNTEKALSYWTDDAIMFEANRPPLKGKQAISEMVKAAMSDSSFKISWEPLSAEVSADGTMGYLIEENNISMKDTTLHFNVVTIWKKQSDGSWKNVVEISTAK